MLGFGEEGRPYSLNAAYSMKGSICKRGNQVQRFQNELKNAFLSVLAVFLLM